MNKLYIYFPVGTINASLNSDIFWEQISSTGVFLSMYFAAIKFITSLYLFAFLLNGCEFKSLQTGGIAENRLFDQSDGVNCGYPLFKSIQEASEISQSNLDRLKNDLKNLDANEEFLMTLVERYPPRMIHRTNSEKAKLITNSGNILSPGYAKERSVSVGHSGYYSKHEESLFSSSHCVFASLGPPDGRPRYGNIEMEIDFKKINKLDQIIWASSTSGYELAVRQSLKGDQLINTFKSTILVPKHFLQWFQYNIIMSLRSKGELKRKAILDELMSVTSNKFDSHEKASHYFWEKIDEYRLGYLEIKFDRLLSLDTIKQIKDDSCKNGKP